MQSFAKSDSQYLLDFRFFFSIFVFSFSLMFENQSTTKDWYRCAMFEKVKEKSEKIVFPCSHLISLLSNLEKNSPKKINLKKKSKGTAIQFNSIQIPISELFVISNLDIST